MTLIKLILICGILITQCYAILKIKIRSSGLADREPPAKVYEEYQLESFSSITAVLFGQILELNCTNTDEKSNFKIFDGLIENKKRVNVAWSSSLLNSQNSESKYPTTKTHRINTTERLFVEYLCGSEDGEIASTAVIIDSLPKILNFSCVWHFGRDSFVSCKWDSPNVIGYYELAFMVEGRRKTCEAKLLPSNSCTFSSSRYLQNLHFDLHACSYLGCVNETYNFSSSIVKLDQPYNLTLLGKDSHHALLELSVLYWKRFNPVYKVEYSVEGMKFQETNPTLAQSPTELFISFGNTLLIYRIVIDLPCAERMYEVRVSLKTAEVGDGLWSDYTSISLITEPADVVDTNPVCAKPDIVLNGPVMVYMVQKLKHDVRKHLVDFKKERPLKKKLHRIKNFY